LQSKAILFKRLCWKSAQVGTQLTRFRWLQRSRIENCQPAVKIVTIFTFIALIGNKLFLGNLSRLVEVEFRGMMPLLSGRLLTGMFP
jgi:hypothetical protein